MALVISSDFNERSKNICTSLCLLPRPQIPDFHNIKYYVPVILQGMGLYEQNSKFTLELNFLHSLLLNYHQQTFSIEMKLPKIFLETCLGL